MIYSPRNSAELQEVQAAISNLEMWLNPATPEEILVVLSRLALHYATNYLSENQLGMVLHDYVEDLEKYPLHLIVEGCKKYRRSEENRYFPRIGQLIALIDPEFKKGLAAKIKLLFALKSSGLQITEEKVDLLHHPNPLNSLVSKMKTT